MLKCSAFSVTDFDQICARWRAVVATYNKSTDCANMPKAVRSKCSAEVGYRYIYTYFMFFNKMCSTGVAFGYRR